MALSNNPLQPLLDLIPKPFRNKFVLVLVLFMLWMIFFDSADILTQYRLNQSVNQLQEDKVFYQEQIDAAQEDKEEIEEDPEKFAREKYYMKKRNEDVFIFEEKE